MNAKKCDRCGRLYEANKSVLDNHEKPVCSLEICYVEDYAIRAIVDLCPNCMNEFLGWLAPYFVPKG